MGAINLSEEMKGIIEHIKHGDLTCMVEYKGEVVFRSKDKGVKPLMDYIALNKDYSPITVKDKIMGKGAMVLAIKCMAHEVITPIISEKALHLAHQYGIHVFYEKVVPYIVNRTGTGSCPIEASVDGIDTIEEAYQAIVKTLEQLRKSMKG